MAWSSVADWLSGYNMRSLMGTGIQTMADLMGIPKSEQNKIVNDIASYPLIGDLVREQQTRDKLEDYMKNTGVGWDDVKYPALLNAGSTVGTAFRIMNSGTNFVSRNLEKLYR